MKITILLSLLFVHSLTSLSQGIYGNYSSGSVSILFSGDEFEMKTSLEDDLEEVLWFKGKISYSNDTLIASPRYDMRKLYFKELSNHTLFFLNPDSFIDKKDERNFRKNGEGKEFCFGLYYGGNIFYQKIAYDENGIPQYFYLWENDSIIKTYDIKNKEFY